MAKPSVWEELPEPLPEFAVDLGLPSGRLWADRNVGAATPEAYGDYFAWGETAPRGENWSADTPYDWAHAPFNNGSEDYDEEYFSANSGTWLNADFTLKPEYDAAHVNMGGNWRMPTPAEMQELIDGTTRTMEELNGIRGLRFTSKANGNSIFMPATGRRRYSSATEVTVFGNVWSSSLDAGNVGFSHYLDFNIGGVCFVGVNNRYYGYVVRGVC